MTRASIRVDRIKLPSAAQILRRRASAIIHSEHSLTA
jgi:hypothetical protein